MKNTSNDLYSMSEINCHGEITPRPSIEPPTLDYKPDVLTIELIGWAISYHKECG